LRSILPSTGTQSSTVEEYTALYRDTGFNSPGIYCPIQEQGVQQLRSILPSTETQSPTVEELYCPVQEQGVQQLRSILPSTGTQSSTVEEYTVQYRNTEFNS
jgi:hypothetical protein